MLIFETKTVLITNNNQILILAKQITFNDFSPHYQTYEVPNKSQIIDEFALVNTY